MSFRIVYPVLIFFIQSVSKCLCLIQNGCFRIYTTRLYNNRRNCNDRKSQSILISNCSHDSILLKVFLKLFSELLFNRSIFTARYPLSWPIQLSAKKLRSVILRKGTVPWAHRTQLGDHIPCLCVVVCPAYCTHNGYSVFYILFE